MGEAVGGRGTRAPLGATDSARQRFPFKGLPGGRQVSANGGSGEQTEGAARRPAHGSLECTDKKYASEKTGAALHPRKF